MKSALTPQADTKPGDILNEAEVACIFRTKPRTIRLWRQSKGLPHFKPTKRVVLFRRDDVLKWLESFRRQTAV